MRYFLGVDPGWSGAVAVLNQHGLVRRVTAMPGDSESVLQEFARIGTEYGASNLTARLERVWGRPGMGGVSMFTFGKNFGLCEAGLIVEQIPFGLVLPQDWQNALECRGNRKEKKRVSYNRAVGLFPHISVTHAIADALLIAEYCRRVTLGGSYRSAESRTHGKEENAQSAGQTKAGGEEGTGATGREEGSRRKARR